MAYISALKMRKAAAALKEQALATIARVDAMETAWTRAEEVEQAALAVERIRHMSDVCSPPRPPGPLPPPIAHVNFRFRRCHNWDLLELAAKRFMLAAQTLKALAEPLDGLLRLASAESFDSLPRDAGSVRFNPHDTLPAGIEATPEEIADLHRRAAEMRNGKSDNRD